MGIFKNRNRQTIAELESYYSSQQKNGMAWLMAFLSLFITVVVLSSIFFGGRLIYRTLTDSNNSRESETSATINENDTQLGSTNVDSTEGTATDNTLSETLISDDASQGSAQESAILGGSVSTGGVVSDEAASTSIPSRNVASAVDSNSEIPDTGADSMLLIVPIAVLAFGYMYSIKRQIQKL